MEITEDIVSKKINKMYKKIAKNGISKEDAYTHVGECMDYNDKIFTDGDLSYAMYEVLEEACKALKNNPKALEQLKKHFEI